MEKSFTYHDPLFPVFRPKTDDKSWDKVIAAHKEKDYKSVVRGILDYVDLNLATRTGNADGSQFDIPHGSVILQLNLNDEEFKVTAPFLDIANSKKIPLLRKVVELNFSPLNLSSIHLEGDELSFRYACPLVLCEPYRTYDALREICIYADSYDDEFITKFDAKHLREPRIEPYSDAMKQQAWANLTQYIEEANAGVAYFESKRAFNLAWDVMVITFMKLEIFLQPQGMLRTEIEKMVSYMTGSQDPMNEKVNRGKKYLEKLANYPREEFDRDLYRTEIFIPFKVRSSAQSVKSSSENPYAQAKKEIDQGNHLGASMTLYYHFFNMFYHNTVEEGVQEAASRALKEASAKPWHEASGILFAALDSILKDQNGGSGPQPDDNARKGGLFSKFFGKTKKGQ